MKFFRSFLDQSKVQKKALLAVWCLLLSVSQNAFCQVSSSGSDAKQLMVKLQSALQTNDTVQAEQISSALQALGTNALPAIRESLPECNKTEASQFISIVHNVKGREATQLLMQIACQSTDSNVLSYAIGAIGNRPIDFELTTNQLERLLMEIRKGEILCAAQASRLLARSQRKGMKEVVCSILDRFNEEIACPTNLNIMFGSYVPPRVYTLNLFLLAFSDLNGKAVGAVKNSIEKATDQDRRKWLTLALGMCGDESVSEDIRHLIEKDQEVYFRSVAVRAYARSAKERAVPVLQALLADMSESEYAVNQEGRPIYPIRIVAHDELAELKRKTKEK